MMELAAPFLLAMLVVTTPLLLAALGELVAERSGVLNIGLEGIMLCGALAAFLVARAAPPGVALLAAAGTGLALAGLFALLVVRLRADAVVTGTALNLVALGGTAAVFERLTKEASGTLLLPELEVDPIPLASLLLVPLLLGFLRWTRPGLLLRACGEDPGAAEALGVPVTRIRFLALLFGGALAGLAGAHLCLAQARTFSEGMTAGRGFLALAVVVCGRWSPLGAVLAALLFGGVSALQFQFQASGSRVPYQLFLVLPYLVTLLLLAVLGGRSRAPAALGR